MGNAPFEVRPGRESDLQHLPAIESAGDAMFAEAGHPEFVGGGTISVEEARQALAELRLTVAVVASEPVGFVVVGRCGDELELQQISVLPRFGGQGIGTALMGRVLDDANAANKPSIVLNTQTDVPWNQPWYERLGFHVVPQQQWTAAMIERTEAQTAMGLRWETRVHMRALLGNRDGATS